MSDTLTAHRPVRYPGRVLAATAVLAALTIYALLTPWLAGPQSADFAQALEPPSGTHWFGTDHSGYDLFVRTAEGLRVSLLIAAVCAVASTAIGTVIGVAAATAGGRVDRVLMRATDTVNALPHLLLGIAIVALYPGSLPAIIASIALTHWPLVARLVRAHVLTARSADYVDVAYLWGATRIDVFRRHLLPAAAPQIAVALLMLLPHAIWHESTLSFLGFGLSPDQASLGTLLELARGDLLTGAWWTLAVPAGTLIVTTLAVAALTSRRRRNTEPESVVA